VTPARRVIRVSSPTSPALRCRGFLPGSGGVTDAALPSGRGGNARKTRQLSHPPRAALPSVPDLRHSLHCCAALIFLLASPATADTCHFGAPGTTVSIASHPEAWGEVTIDNRLAYRTRTGPCVLYFDAGDVSVTYDPGPFREPDIFVIETPEGLRADPDWLLVEDETSVRVLVWPIAEGEGM